MAVISDCLAKLVCLTNQLTLSNEQPKAHPTTSVFVNENRFAFYYEISSGGEWSKVGMDEKERKRERRRRRKV